MSDPVCVILAAGLSLRFGRPKQLALFEGETLIHRAVRIALAAGCSRTIVIVPADSPEIRRELSSLAVEIMENSNPRAGMSSSMRLAAHAAADGPLLLTLADQPHVTSEHLRALIATQAPIAVTRFNGTTGPPAFFDERFLPLLLTLTGDHGAREIVRAHHDQVTEIPFDGAAVDIDTEDDLRDLESGGARSSR